MQRQDGPKQIFRYAAPGDLCITGVIAWVRWDGRKSLRNRIWHTRNISKNVTTKNTSNLILGTLVCVQISQCNLKAQRAIINSHTSGKASLHKDINYQI